MGEDEEKKFSAFNVFLIVFGVIAFGGVILSFVSFVYFAVITGSVVGGVQKNIYNFLFFLALLGVFVFLEILIMIKKRKKGVDIHELVERAREEWD